MKKKFIIILFSLLIFSSCSANQEKTNEDLSVIVISSDHSVGKNILSFAILDNNGNQITNELEKVLIKNIELGSIELIKSILLKLRLFLLKYFSLLSESRIN